MANELNLLDWTVESYVEGYGENLAVASYNVEPDTCLKCGRVGELQRWGRNRMTVRDAPNYGKPFRNAPGHGVVLIGMGDHACDALHRSRLGMVWDRRVNVAA